MKTLIDTVQILTEDHPANTYFTETNIHRTHRRTEAKCGNWSETSIVFSHPTFLLPRNRIEKTNDCF